jgi:hypothetical protein
MCRKFGRGFYFVNQQQFCSFYHISKFFALELRLQSVKVGFDIFRSVGPS